MFGCFVLGGCFLFNCSVGYLDFCLLSLVFYCCLVTLFVSLLVLGLISCCVCLC